MTKPYTKEHLIEKLQEAFVVLGFSPTQSALDKLPGFPTLKPYRNHFGTLEKAKKIAGVPGYAAKGRWPGGHGRTPLTEEYLIKKLQEAFTILGSSPRRIDLKKLPNFPSHTTYRNRFGSLTKAKVAAGIPLLVSRQTKNPGRKIRAKLRFQVLHRDNFTCQYCGRTPQDGVKLQVDHIVSYKNGGKTLFENLITACFQCNQGKQIMNLSHLPKKKPKSMNRNAIHQTRLF